MRRSTTTAQTTTVPRLDLAPKRKKPLSLWNPLDYLTLLYWAFFFPQALRWYVERFGKPEYQKKARREVWVVLRIDPAQRNLVMQMLVVLLILLPVAALGLESLGVPIYWPGVAFGMAGGVGGGILLSVMFSIALGVAFGVVGGVAVGVALGVAFGVTGGVAVGVAGGIAGGVAVGVALGTAAGVAVDVAGNVAGGVAAGVVGGIALSVAGGIELGVAFGVAVSIAAGVAASRPAEWLFASLLWRVRGTPPREAQLAWLPLPGFQCRIENWLENDWQVGVHNLYELLAFTLQFIPVIGALNAVLDRISEDQLLVRLVVLTQASCDWDLIHFSSAPLLNTMWIRAMRDAFALPAYMPWLRRYLCERFPIALRLDTPARAACAGFWYWHEKEADKAAEAFAVVKDIPHGAEIYGIAQAIVAGQQVETLQALAMWDGVGRNVGRYVGRNVIPTYSELRPGTLRALRILGNVAAEASTAHHAVAPLNRSAALGRANAALTNLLETGADFCPELEWPLIEEIAKKWRDIVSKAGGVIGEEVLRRPVLNPYEGSSGLPVTGPTFVGRKAIIMQIERHWAGAGALPPLILYGHRRMGKSSILRNLDKGLPPGHLLVYLDMQNSSFVNHTGELLLDIAEAIYRVAHTVIPSEARNLSPVETRPFASLRVTAPDPEDYTTLGAARRALNVLLKQLALSMQDRRLILAVDEFEVIQDGIDAERIDADVLKYLRSRIQEYHWLGLIFAGLHQLDELGRDYKSVFYGQAEHIRVSYLREADALDLIARPHPDFALEYAPELRAGLYRLTYGQPYLLQRLCWELVERWNERFMREGEATPREVALDELPAILTPDFFHAAGYYFDGVWSNITEDERAVLREMSARESPWTREEVAAALPAVDLDNAFMLLHRHDVVLEDDASADAGGSDAGGLRFASELLRRWIVQFSTD